MPKSLLHLLIVLLVLGQGVVALIPGRFLCLPVPVSDSTAEHGAMAHEPGCCSGHGPQTAPSRSETPPPCDPHEHERCAMFGFETGCRCHAHVPLPRDQQPPTARTGFELGKKAGEGKDATFGPAWQWTVFNDGARGSDIWQRGAGLTHDRTRDDGGSARLRAIRVTRLRV